MRSRGAIIGDRGGMNCFRNKSSRRGVCILKMETLETTPNQLNERYIFPTFSKLPSQTLELEKCYTRCSKRTQEAYFPIFFNFPTFGGFRSLFFFKPGNVQKN